MSGGVTMDPVRRLDVFDYFRVVRLAASRQTA